MYTKKTVLEVAPVFRKKVKRIEAILFFYFVALMIVSLIERKIRINMTKAKIEKLPILPQTMNTKKPTWNNIRYILAVRPLTFQVPRRQVRHSSAPWITDPLAVVSIVFYFYCGL